MKSCMEYQGPLGGARMERQPSRAWKSSRMLAWRPEGDSLTQVNDKKNGEATLGGGECISVLFSDRASRIDKFTTQQE